MTEDLDVLEELINEQASKVRDLVENNPTREHWNAHNNLREAAERVHSAQLWLLR